MTLREKLSLIDGTGEDPKTYQDQAGYLAGVPRLGIPGMRFADGPPGLLTRVPAQGMPATMAVAATFSRKLARQNGETIGREARSLGIDVVLQPFINIDRDLIFGRSYNTLGEDPFLSGEIGAAEITGIQSQHVLAQAKHFVGYDSASYNVAVDEQTLHEVYLAPFDAAVRAGVSSIMCSYNRINGTYSCGNSTTLTKMLRSEMGFKGFVTSDWGATHAVTFINAGLDMEMAGEPWHGKSNFDLSFFDFQPPVPAAAPRPAAPRPTGFAATTHIYGRLPEEKYTQINIPWDGSAVDPKKMPEALRDGTVTEEAITRAARRVLTQMVHFGLLDGYSKHTVTPQDMEQNARVIEQTGEAAAVLLKNDGAMLPLQRNELADTVFIGPTAGQVDAIGIAGERSIGLTERQIGPLDAVKKISGITAIPFAVADDMTGTPIPAEIFTHDGKPGLERNCGAAKSTDAALNFSHKNGLALAPDSKCVWRGELRVVHSGEYWFYLQALGTNAEIRIDQQILAKTGAVQGGIHGDIVQAGQDNVLPTTDGLDNVRRPVQIEAGLHLIEVTVSPDSSHAEVQLRLNWYTPDQRKADYASAVNAARHAKRAVVFAWARVNPVFQLPGDQNQLIEDVAAVNPNTIVVLNTSQPVALPWIDKVKAVLQMWWPGDEGGWSTANLLLGKTSPAGRLPVSWGHRLEDYPATDPRFPERGALGVNGKTTYSEGLDVGYRWFEHEKREPLFAFGFGLSYTKFDYSQLEVQRASDGGLDVSATIHNTGAVDSDEVPQVYLGAPEKIPAGVHFALHTLGGFDRVHLGAGQSTRVILHVPQRQLQYWSTAEDKWVTASGKRVVSMGLSSRELLLNAVIEMP
jgi:beta-glucosidase